MNWVSHEVLNTILNAIRINYTHILSSFFPSYVFSLIIKKKSCTLKLKTSKKLL